MLKQILEDEFIIEKDFFDDCEEWYFEDYLLNSSEEIIFKMINFLYFVNSNHSQLKKFIKKYKKFLKCAMKHEKYPDLFKFMFKIIFFISKQKCVADFENLFTEEEKLFNMDNVMSNYDLLQFEHCHQICPTFIVFCGAIYCYYFNASFSKGFGVVSSNVNLSNANIRRYGHMFNITKYSLAYNYPNFGVYYPKTKIWNPLGFQQINILKKCEVVIFYMCNEIKMRLILEAMNDTNENFIVVSVMRDYFKAGYEKFKNITSLKNNFEMKSTYELYCYYIFPFEADFPDFIFKIDF